MVINLPYGHTPVLDAKPGMTTSVAFVTYYMEEQCAAMIQYLDGKLETDLGPQPLQAIIVRFLVSKILILLDY